jgi:outer membrane protein OmpA-like peptidoglycan-associated protein
LAPPIRNGFENAYTWLTCQCPYYLSADVEAGGLLTQLEISGRAKGERRLTLELLGPDGRAVDSVFVRSGFGTKEERTKVFVIDSAQRAVLRLIAEGEENGEFCLLVGGGTLPSLKPHSCPASADPAASAIPDEYSTSILQPSAADSGLTAGKLPGGTAVKYYYLSADLTAGSLMTQLQITGRPHGERRLTLELLGPDARVAESTFVRAGFGAKDESTKTFAIDASGRRFMRLIVEGDAPGNFCLLMGGTALPGGGAQDCPANAAAAAPPPPSVTAPPPVRVIATPAAPPKSIEVIVTKCEERLRVQSDFLFDFDRADIYPEADSALRELANRSDLARRRIIIEGHTDGKGTDSYNQRLSERRADAVRAALINHGMFPDDLIVHGFGKSHPIAPNQNSDGSDNAEGRLKNRRVELVVNTCG